MKWTAEDQRLLDELIQRRDEVFGKNMASLKEAMRAPLYEGCAEYEDELLRLMTVHADSIRDALLPFDSGTRVKANN